MPPTVLLIHVRGGESGRDGETGERSVFRTRAPRGASTVEQHATKPPYICIFSALLRAYTQRNYIVDWYCIVFGGKNEAFAKGLTFFFLHCSIGVCEQVRDVGGAGREEKSTPRLCVSCQEYVGVTLVDSSLCSCRYSDPERREVRRAFLPVPSLLPVFFSCSPSAGGVSCVFSS